MTRFPAWNGPYALVVTALAALSLAACGTQRAGSAEARPAVASVAGTDQEAAFMEMLKTVEGPCVVDPGKSRKGPASPPPAPLPAPPGEEVPVDAITPGPPEPGPQTELGDVDWCTSHRHIERVTQALLGVPDPTPAEVGKVLNGLGYSDGRIHGLERSGAVTRFFLDLRVMGGRLCLEGSAAGEETDIEACVAPETGPFTPPPGRSR